VYEIVVEIVFQSVFRLEKNQNNVFFIFFKFIFDINKSKRSKNKKKYLEDKEFKKFQNCGPITIPNTTRVIYCRKLLYYFAFKRSDHD
jgi:hypothetical protein